MKEKKTRKLKPIVHFIPRLSFVPNPWRMGTMNSKNFGNRFKF